MGVLVSGKYLSLNVARVPIVMALSQHNIHDFNACLVLSPPLGFKFDGDRGLKHRTLSVCWRFEGLTIIWYLATLACALVIKNSRA